MFRDMLQRSLGANASKLRSAGGTGSAFLHFSLQGFTDVLVRHRRSFLARLVVQDI